MPTSPFLRRVLLAGGTLLLTAAVPAPRDTTLRAREVVARDPGARMERLADGVYAIVHDDATHDWPSGTTNWPHGNTGVIVGQDAVAVIDAPISRRAPAPTSRSSGA